MIFGLHCTIRRVRAAMAKAAVGPRVRLLAGALYTVGVSRDTRRIISMLAGAWCGAVGTEVGRVAVGAVFASPGGNAIQACRADMVFRSTLGAVCASKGHDTLVAVCSTPVIHALAAECIGLHRARDAVTVFATDGVEGGADHTDCKPCTLRANKQETVQCRHAVVSLLG